MCAEDAFVTGVLGQLKHNYQHVGDAAQPGGKAFHFGTFGGSRETSRGAEGISYPQNSLTQKCLPFPDKLRDGSRHRP